VSEIAADLAARNDPKKRRPTGKQKPANARMLA
jgi:hypothetical protein